MTPSFSGTTVHVAMDSAPWLKVTSPAHYTPLKRARETARCDNTVLAPV